MKAAKGLMWTYAINSVLAKKAKIFVYKHSFCYLSVENVKQKNSLFHQPIVLWVTLRISLLYKHEGVRR